MEESIVSLINVEKKFGTNLVVQKMNMEIHAGEFLTLLGPSGCGKTTTLRMIAGFEDATGGMIKVQGERVEDKEPYEREVNTVFQNYALFPHMTVYDNVAYGLMIKKVPKSEIKIKVDEMLQLVQLEGYEKRKPDELSGGQKQRVAIARALINNPKVLLLDEPLGALDLKLRKQMQIELKRLQRKLGITFVYVTHDQEEALTMSDRIAVMRNGIIEQLASPMEIYNHPKTKFVAGFIGETNLFEGVVIHTENKYSLIDTSSGQMTVMTTEAKIGDKVYISVRPEYISASTIPVEGFELAGKIKDFTYLGTAVKTAVELKDGYELKYSGVEKEEGILEDDQVYIYFKPEKAVAIKVEDESGEML